MEVYTVKVEEATLANGGQPSAGAVYRSIYAKDGLLQLPSEIESPWDLFRGAVEKYPQNPMLGRRQVTDGKVAGYVWQTYQQVYDLVMNTGSALRRRGVNPGDRCGIYGPNCPEWVMAMEACNSQGICYVPLYDTLGANAVEFIINHAEMSIAFVHESKITSVSLSIVSFGGMTKEQKREAENWGITCFSWQEFICLGNADSGLPIKKKDDVCTIMYTSGTTGDPKGVILTNEALVAEVLTYEHLFRETDRVVTEEDSYFSFLPLAHIFDQIMENYCIYKGASIGFWQGDIRYLMEDIQEMKPTVFCGVPRVYDRVYSGIQQKIASGGLLARKLFEYAYDYKLTNMKKGLAQHEASPFFDNLVFSKIKQGLGGRVRIMISGAAPLPRHVEEFMRVTSGSIFVQGYVGLTESTAGCFTSIANKLSMMGTVGAPVTTIEARLESVPEMGYDALSSEPRGEICIRGTTLFSGYHKRPNLNNEGIIDGWFHTGDIGEWQPDGTMKIIDRKKNIFKLSQGEYVAVEVLESAYMQCPLVTMVWVYGNSFESFLVGVVVPERKALEDWALLNNVSGSFEELCNYPKARNYVLEEINNTGRKFGLKGFEMLKAIILDPTPFSIERDLITPTFKLKRPQLLKYYKERIDAMYEEVKGAAF
ncbi:long chain acyl-CoA synthetase 2 [Carex littledalei]|uniref:Long-chain-fatty-acid--CoA ligase n=1 Tax=Carex littledalei TaxID=544730 RepID=A0A833QHH3_9POAL|nr:long chain acyl-CoA synthetase 2 [Carex littledalei]